jgi:hypothetical protein
MSRREAHRPASVDYFHVKSISAGEDLDIMTTVRPTGDTEIDRCVSHPQLSKRHFRHPLWKCRMEAQHTTAGIGVEAEERGNEMDDRP